MKIERKKINSKLGRMRMESAARLLGIAESDLWRRPVRRTGGRAMRHGELRSVWAGDWDTLRNLCAEHWRMRICEHHPDRGGCPRIAASINAAHQWMQRRINDLDPRSHCNG